MANRKGLGVSKKYTKGSVHETASGRFTILDRYADEDDDKNIPMLEYQWLSGDKEGQVETNREMNISASIHKFQTSRGIPTIQAEPKMIDEEISFVEKIDKTYEVLKNLTEHFSQDEVKINMITNGLEKLDEVLDMHKYNRQHVEKAVQMIKDMEITVAKNKENIASLTETVRELVHGSMALTQLQETIASQQALINKLIEKLPGGQ
jgi:hypothetical protein